MIGLLHLELSASQNSELDRYLFFTKSPTSGILLQQQKVDNLQDKEDAGELEIGYKIFDTGIRI